MTSAKVKFGATLALITILSLAFATSCNEKKEAQAIATIDGEPITSDIIDEAVGQEVYQKLCEIYDIRRQAVQELLSIKLIDNAAKENNITADSLIARYVAAHSPDSLTTAKARNRLTDSLAQGHDIRLLLKAPIAPAVGIDTVGAHRRGKIGARVVVTEITDFDCGLCQALHEEVESIYAQYADRVEFRTIDLAPEPSMATEAAMAADAQGKYWEMRDALMRIHSDIDSAKATDVAANLGLDLCQFASDMADDNSIREIKRNSIQLAHKGIRSTPTFLINNHPIRLTSGTEDLRIEIERALNETH